MTRNYTFVEFLIAATMFGMVGFFVFALIKIAQTIHVTFQLPFVG